MVNYKYLIFDIDGTLTDSKEGILNSFKYALLKYGIKCDNVPLDIVGPPLKDSFMKLFNFSEKDAIDAVAFYRERFLKHGITQENRLYDGIYELVYDLKNKGYILITASSKPEEQCKIIMDYFNLSKHFDAVFGASLDSSRASKDKVIEYAISKMGIKDKNDAVLIGDTRYDLIGAKKVGIDAISVSYGYGEKEELKEYESIAILDSVNDLRNYLL
ncbi:MAG: HAD family hydrolase [Ruminococcaceae bacterium]|nr:HAD family hydrolase [Oscillospiraceae bacterium]